MPTTTAGRSVLADALKATTPVMLGYLTLGTVFGLVASEAGVPWWMAMSMSLLMYAGAGQFALVGLFAAGAGPLEAMLVSFTVNVRHFAYGFSMLGRFASWPRYRPYLAFALTDETFALLSTLPSQGERDGRFMFAVAALDQCWWVLGTLAGSLAGALLPFRLAGLDFALTALFIVLLIEQTGRVREIEPFALAALSSVLGTLLAGARTGLVVGMAGGLAAMWVVAALRRKGGATGKGGVPPVDAGGGGTPS